MTPHIPTVLIVADDLTGALDSAVAFAGGGRRVTVARGVGRIEAALRERPVVLALDTGSRERNIEAATETMEAVARALPLGAVPVIIKKVDSRLKGQIHAEVSALRRLSGRTRVIAAPAIPQMGRLQIGGLLTGDGIEGSIDVAALIGRDVETPDVETDEALDRYVVSQDAATLWVGARGLAFALSRSIFNTAPAPPPVLKASALLALGSRDPITLAQINALRRPFHRAPDGAVPEGSASCPVDIVVMTDGGQGLGATEAGAAFADGITARIRRMCPATLLVCGGETASAILDRLEIRLVDVIGEIAPGVPVSLAEVPWGRMKIITKSGGFGSLTLLQWIAKIIT